MWMEAHNLNLVIMTIVSFPLCIRSQEVWENRQYPQSYKFYRMYKYTRKKYL